MVPFENLGVVFFLVSVVTGSILHQFGDKARYLSKIVFFSYLLEFDAPVRGLLVGILSSRLVRKN